jgi:drug/metabolite transporter (DMT)-like permease
MLRLENSAMMGEAFTEQLSVKGSNQENLMNDAQIYGMLAALGASVTWGTNSLMFTYAGSRVGSDTVTHIRLWIALVIMLVVHFVIMGTLLPHSMSLTQFLYLAASGVCGFVIGDMFLFEAFLLLGTQPALLIKTLAPAFAALVSHYFLSESLTVFQIGSIGLTLTGIALVVAKKNHQGGASSSLPRRLQTNAITRGTLYAGLAAIGQAAAMVLAKPAMSAEFSPLSATLMRLTVATPVMALIILSRKRMKLHLSVVKNRRAFTAIFLGTLLGTVLGVILAMYAVQHAPVGIASTLMELSPAVVLIISTLFLKAKIEARQWMGTALALSGSFLLVWSAAS